MASSADPVVNFPSIRATDICSIKAVADESAKLSAIAATYNSLTDPRQRQVSDELTAQIPIIDFSLLLSNDPQLHAKAVQHLAKACKEWGFFMVISHGIPVSLIDDVISLSQEFHNLSDEDKAEFTDKGVLTPIRETRKVARKLLEGISESLDLEPEAIAKATGFDTGHQVFIANLYPPCPRPELALGMPPHSDHGFLALLIQNDIGGIQISHKGNWVNVEPLPNSILVNTADQLEVASNRRYRSVLHRAVVNKKETRISVVTVNGPDLEKEKNRLDGKTCMDHIRIKPRE
ncbi:hypothetical protein K1719_014127 [Acacia pycnantha]|nr:hypothetical protein K1719_014127 [Acacia pycnantha]